MFPFPKRVHTKSFSFKSFAMITIFAHCSWDKLTTFHIKSRFPCSLQRDASLKVLILMLLLLIFTHFTEWGKTARCDWQSWGFASVTGILKCNTFDTSSYMIDVDCKQWPSKSVVSVTEKYIFLLLVCPAVVTRCAHFCSIMEMLTMETSLRKSGRYIVTVAAPSQHWEHLLSADILKTRPDIAICI